MIRKQTLSILLSLLFLSTACSEKKSYITKIENNITTFTQGDYAITQLSQELSSSLDIPIKDYMFYQNIDRTLGEVTLIKLPTTLCIILNGQIFTANNDAPIHNANYILEDITKIIKKYPRIVVQVIGHSDKATEENHQDLSDNRAISIAEIIYNLEARNDTYAKGCGDRKPLFTTFNTGESISNARIEIYLYGDKEKMIDHCN